VARPPGCASARLRLRPAAPRAARRPQRGSAESGLGRGFRGRSGQGRAGELL